MANKHFEIKINVSYDPTTIPDDMEKHLRKRVMAAADRGSLLSDFDDEAIVEAWCFEIKETTLP